MSCPGLCMLDYGFDFTHDDADNWTYLAMLNVTDRRNN